MRYYFAGAYARRAELARYADQIEAAGIRAEVHSRWLVTDQSGDDAGFSAGGMETPESAAAAWRYAEQDITDLSVCQVIVSFTGEGARGGRHVEYGFALAWAVTTGTDPNRDGMRLVIVGPREHVFHCHPAAEVYPDFAAFLSHEIDNARPRGDRA